MTAQYIIVGLIIAAAVAAAIVGLWRTFRGRRRCSCGSCPLSDSTCRHHADTESSCRHDADAK